MSLDDLILRTIPDTVRRYRKTAMLFIVLVVIGCGFMGYVAFALPFRDVGPEQPIPFSHRLHVTIKEIDCRFCHSFVERSARAGIPEVGKCLYCHNYVIPMHPQIQKEHNYFNTGEPVPWKRVFIAYDHVQFRHQPHVYRAGLDCVECHGDVGKMDRLPKVEFKMGFCINCHRKTEFNANQQCWLACHN